MKKIFNIFKKPLTKIVKLISPLVCFCLSANLLTAFGSFYIQWDDKSLSLSLNDKGLCLNTEANAPMTTEELEQHLYPDPSHKPTSDTKHPVAVLLCMGPLLIQEQNDTDKIINLLQLGGDETEIVQHVKNGYYRWKNGKLNGIADLILDPFNRIIPTSTPQSSQNNVENWGICGGIRGTKQWTQGFSEYTWPAILAFYGKWKALQLLLEAPWEGQDAIKEYLNICTPKDLDGGRANGDFALSCAVQSCNPECVAILLRQKGILPNQIHPRYGIPSLLQIPEFYANRYDQNNFKYKNAVYIAKWRDFFDDQQRMLQYFCNCSDVNLNVQDANGETIAHKCIKNDRADLMFVLALDYLHKIQNKAQPKTQANIQSIQPATESSSKPKDESRTISVDDLAARNDVQNNVSVIDMSIKNKNNQRAIDLLPKNFEGLTLQEKERTVCLSILLNLNRQGGSPEILYQALRSEHYAFTHQLDKIYARFWLTHHQQASKEEFRQHLTQTCNLSREAIEEKLLYLWDEEQAIRPLSGSDIDSAVAVASKRN